MIYLFSALAVLILVAVIVILLDASRVPEELEVDPQDERSYLA